MSGAKKPTVLALVGPTGSGKTRLSLEIAAQLNAEIIACDSRTVYRHFDIGTAKPSPAEQARVRHHLIDVAEPDENYTVSRFTQEAHLAIAAIEARAALPLVCGGTGFYARALLEGLLIPAVPPQEALRAELNAIAAAQGNQILYERLQAVDPKTAERLNVNDRFRIVRALEVFTVTGLPFSEVSKKCDPPYNTIWIGLNARDRVNLHNNIRLRFDEQLAQGLIEETEKLYLTYGASQKLMHTVNYKQLVQMLEGKLDRAAACKEALQQNVQLARRQLIWFRTNPQIRWFEFDTSGPQELTEAVLSHIGEAMSA